jgi:hypothetical protein
LQDAAGRVLSALDGLKTSGLDKNPLVREIQYERASPDTIKLVHTSKYVDDLARVVKELVRFLGQDI